MLTEIKCDKFERGVIEFHKGLNVVLGDEKATNSIGKSMLLMVIDYVMGGESFIKSNSDAITELGDHEYLFNHNFDGQNYKFKRGTANPGLVYQCDDNYEEAKAISIFDYTNFLFGKYQIPSIDTTFRTVVSLYSRVWGKENHNVNLPLHSFRNQKAVDAVDNLIKLFNKYSEIKELSKNRQEKTESKEALISAFKKKYIPEISKSEYIENQAVIEKRELEISEIKEKLSEFACNINEIINAEIMELKLEKDDLLNSKLEFESNLDRVRKNLDSSKHITSKQLAKLKTFFPDVNMERLARIENFHSGLSGILHNELKLSEEQLVFSINEVKKAIDGINEKISTTLAKKLAPRNVPSVIVDRVYDLSNQLTKAKTESYYYEEKQNISIGLKEIDLQLKEEKQITLASINDLINETLRTITTEIYSGGRQYPALILRDKNYTYQFFEDTGTGKAYSNLIVLDLALFSLTYLPFIIHDSFLFKNIENDAVAKIIALYTETNKQSFIAIDEASKYGNEASQYLHNNAVIELSNEHLLYIKDWRIVNTSGLL